MKTYTLLDPEGQILFTHVPEDKREEALQQAMEIYATISSLLGGRPNMQVFRQNCTWKEEAANE